MPAPTSSNLTRPDRPPKEERHRATLRALADRSDSLRRTARRYSATPEDADDAFARGIEMALEKAPSTDLDELIPWLRTVIKHEAFALRRKAARALPSSDEPEVLERSGMAPDAAEQVIVMERLATAAEALRQLKPQEAQAMRLLAEGFTYAEIRARTGWTYTKVNRCLTEGRASFRHHVRASEGIEL